jgi:glycosyltransferase involved in cell wall biosynthesis
VLRQNRSKSSSRACFIYYTIFKTNALLYREAKSLKERGFDVDIICLRNSLSDKIFQTFHGLNLYCIQSRSSREKKVALYFLRLILFFIKSSLLLTYLGLKKRYNLIHITTPPDVMVLAATIPKLLGAKIILDIHDIGPELYMRKLNISENNLIIIILKYLEKISCRFANHVITVTDLWREKLIKRSVSQEKCSVLLNVPDEDIFKPLSIEKKQSSNGCNLYYHGSLEEHFGVDTLLKAMPVIKQYIPNAVLHIYGGGRLLEDLKNLSENLGIQDCVRFHDTVPFYELPEILLDADIGIVPTKDSVFSNEALSMKSFEYISLGIPIVISRTKAHSYYYRDLMVKFFEPNNSEDLATSVVTLYKDENERKRLIYYADSFIQKHGWNQSKKIYFQVIDRLLST